MVYHGTLNIAVYAYSRTLLFISSVYKSLHLAIPTSQSIPPPSPSPLATTSQFPISMSLFHRSVHLCHILDSTYK